MSQTIFPAPAAGMNVAVQRGEISMGDPLVLLDVPIASVNLARSFVVITCRFLIGSAHLMNTLVTATLTSTTNIRFERGGTGAGLVISWQVISYL